MKVEIELETLNFLSERSSDQNAKKKTGKLLFHPVLSKDKNQSLKTPEKKLGKDYISLIQSLLF